MEPIVWNCFNTVPCTTAEITELKLYIMNHLLSPAYVLPPRKIPARARDPLWWTCHYSQGSVSAGETVKHSLQMNPLARHAASASESNRTSLALIKNFLSSQALKIQCSLITAHMSKWHCMKGGICSVLQRSRDVFSEPSHWKRHPSFGWKVLLCHLYTSLSVFG